MQCEASQAGDYKSGCFGSTFIHTRFIQCSGQAIRCQIDWKVEGLQRIFSREENVGKIAQMSGKSHYMKFYPPIRVIRLFIPYPYSTAVKAEAISSVFEEVSKKTVGDAFIRGKFGEMDENVIANIGTVKTGSDVILFDCESSSPCKIIFMDNSLQLIKKGILADHILDYEGNIWTKVRLLQLILSESIL